MFFWFVSEQSLLRQGAASPERPPCLSTGRVYENHDGLRAGVAVGHGRGFAVGRGTNVSLLIILSLVPVPCMYKVQYTPIKNVKKLLIQKSVSVRSNGVSKNPFFHTDFKNVHMTLLKSAPKESFAQKTDFFRTLSNFQLVK
jgi:hypothetical protein